MGFTAGFPRRAAALIALLALAPFATMAGEPDLDLDSQAGKVVIVDFWASWCVPCRRSFPWLNQMHRKYGEDGLVIIGVNLDHERGEADRFLQEFPPDFRILFDASGELAKQFNVVAMPSSYLIGRSGDVLNRHLGFQLKQQDEYEAAIVAALKESE